MFGLFGSRNEAKVYDELLAYLTSGWEMKEHYARAFLGAYRASIAKIYKQVLKQHEALERAEDPELRLMNVAMGGKEEALNHVLVAQAYQAYKSDLQKGSQVGTDVELVIWAILSNRADILERIDASLMRFIDKELEARFPDLFDKIFAADA